MSSIPLKTLGMDLRAYMLKLLFSLKSKSDQSSYINSYQMILIILSLVVCSLTIQFKDCNASELQYFSHYSLGKQNQLNVTFERLNKEVASLPTITYNSSDLLFRYGIVAAKAQFTYRDTYQTAEVISNDVIYIKGGKAQALIYFDYYRNDKQGKGTAQCLSDPISFAKLIYMDEGFIKFKIGDYINISYYGRKCNITRLDPPLEQKDVNILEIMFNENDDHNIKNELEAEVGGRYAKILNESLYEEKMKISNQSFYIWTNSQGKNFTINYTHLPVGGHLENIGLFLIFVTQITDDDNWKCGAAVPFAPKDYKVYGGIQQFLSLSVLQNTIRYAVDHQQLNSMLNRNSWESKVFQFFAGDLYEIIPYTAQKHRAAQVIEGNCNATSTNLKLAQSEGNRLLLSMHYNCDLFIGSQKIGQFDVDPNFVVEIVPYNRYLDFKVVKVNKFAHFKDVGDYKINDIQLANLFLIRSLQKLVGETVFGSGWPIYPRDYPSIAIEDGILFIYDKAA